MTQAPLTLLGFDYGLRRIGVAVGQTLTGTAQPLALLEPRAGATDWEGIERLVKEWRPQALVVGLPRNMDGTPHAMTRSAKAFGEALGKRTGLPVHFTDERLTSVEAEQRVIQSRARQGRSARIAKGTLDPVAAQILLESWMAARGEHHD